MKKWSLWLIISLVFFGCGNPKQILVEYQKGDQKSTILRQDLQFIVSLNQFEHESDVSVAIQNQILEELAFLNVGKLEYESLQKSQREQQEIKKALLLLDRRAFLNAMNFVLQEKVSDFNFKFIGMQLLFLKKIPNLDRTEEANQILKQLNEAKSEEEIQKIIFEKNENFRYKILGGYVDPFCYNCGDNPLSDLTDPLLKEKNKKFILISNQQGYWLLRKLDVEEVKEDGLQNLFEKYHKKSQFAARKFFNHPDYTKSFDENQLKAVKQQILMDEKKIAKLSEEQAKHQIRLLKKNALNSHIQQLREKYKFQLNEKTFRLLGETPVSKWNKETLLFEYNQKKYWIRDFFQEIRKENVEPEEIPASNIFSLLNRVYITSEILYLSPYVKEAKAIQDRFKDLIIKQIYTNFYIQKELNQIQIKNDEMKKYYELRKYNEFKNIPFGKAKNRIKQTLLAEKRQNRVEEIKKELFKKYKVKIYKDRLKEGEV